MELKSVLKQLKISAGTEKTAEEKPAGESKIAVARESLQGALDVALKQAEKVASSTDTSASDSLEKMASDLASADREAMIKEANLYGAAIMDGFVARGSQYGVDVEAEKTAAAEETEFVKWAQENPELFKKNFNDGFTQATEQKEAQEKKEIEKWASTPEGKETLESFSQGYDATKAQIEKLASTDEGKEKLASFGQGYNETVEQLTKIAAEENGQEKLAAVAKGFADGQEAIVKLANDSYSQGFNATVGLLKA